MIQTPYEAWKCPWVSHLKIFGCIAYALDNSSSCQKLDVKSAKCIFVGYSFQTKAYKLYNPVNGKVIINRDVVFNEAARWDCGAEISDMEQGHPMEISSEKPETTAVSSHTISSLASSPGGSLVRSPGTSPESSPIRSLLSLPVRDPSPAPLEESSAMSTSLPLKRSPLLRRRGRWPWMVRSNERGDDAYQVQGPVSCKGICPVRESWFWGDIFTGCSFRNYKGVLGSSGTTWTTYVAQPRRFIIEEVEDKVYRRGRLYMG